MSRLFKRAWKLVIETGPQQNVAKNNEVLRQGAVLNAFAERFDFSGLDMEFRIKRSLRPAPNTGEITIYNLNQKHRAELTQHKKKIVQLHAGYEDGVSMIFAGDVRTTVHEHWGTEWTTKISAGDGERAWQSSRLSKSYGPDTPLRVVLEAVAKGLKGIGIGNAIEAFADAGFLHLGQAMPSGTVLYGMARSEMSALCRACNLEWSIQNHTLLVMPRGESRNIEQLVLTPSSGLVSVPTVSDKNIVKAKTLLIPDLDIGRRVRFDQTDGANGTFRIEQIEYSGTTRGQDWYAELTCKPVAIGQKART